MSGKAAEPGLYGVDGLSNAGEVAASPSTAGRSQRGGVFLSLMIVCHNRQRRRWFRAAPTIPGWWFPNDDLDAESIAFEMLFGSAPEISYAQKIGADARFSFRGADRHEVREQSFLLPNDEVLTLPTPPKCELLCNVVFGELDYHSGGACAAWPASRRTLSRSQIVPPTVSAPPTPNSCRQMSVISVKPTRADTTL